MFSIGRSVFFAYSLFNHIGYNIIKQKLIERSLMNKLGKYFCQLALIILLAVGTLHLFKADFYYDTDIARDLLLLEEMVEEKKLSLIGGRTSVSGIFHGPFYYWLMLPFFILSNGNPVILSYLWFIIYLAFVVAFYYVGKKIFDDKISLISTTFLTSLTISYSEGFTHTVLANFLIIPLIYLVYQYIKTNKIGWLLSAVLINGLIIQFQMAFGVPVLILLGGYTIYHIISNRHFSHLLSGLLLIIPLSTFVVFDLRHEFIQFNSILSNLSGENGGSYSLNGYWPDRWTSFIDTFHIWLIPITELQNFVQLSAVILLIWLAWKNYKANKKSNLFITLSTLLIFGFWLVTSPYKGNVWPQYYRALLPVIILSLTYAMIKYLPKKISFIILAIIIGSNTLIVLNSGINYFKSTPTSDEIHWKFYRQLAEDVIADSKGKKFGYYIFTPDQFAYQAKYAMRYFTKAKKVAAVSYAKQPITYLIESAYWDDNKFLKKEDWRNNQVRIEREPDASWGYSTPNKNSYTVLRYELSDQEMSVSSDPNLIDGIHFR